MIRNITFFRSPCPLSVVFTITVIRILQFMYQICIQWWLLSFFTHGAYSYKRDSIRLLPSTPAVSLPTASYAESRYSLYSYFSSSFRLFPTRLSCQFSLYNPAGPPICSAWAPLSSAPHYSTSHSNNQSNTTEDTLITRRASITSLQTSHSLYYKLGLWCVLRYEIS